MNRRGNLVRGDRDRLSRSEPFEVFTRPQRSLPARLLGLVIRLRAELFVGLVTLVVGLWLVERMPAWAAGALAVVLALAVAVWTPSRRYVVRRGLAVLTRHRLRAVFVERRVMNHTGNVPVLFWSRPTPVGERVWLLVRAGIDARDIEHNLSHVAAGCFAADARVTTHPRISALVVVDVIRRDPLSGSTVDSPLGTPTPLPVSRMRPVTGLPTGGGRSA